MTRRTRRTFLAAAGGLTAGLAGCLGLMDEELTESNSTTEETTSETGSVIRSVKMDETDLVVELDSEVHVDRITIIDPMGEAFADRAVTTGATRLTFEIGTRYRPGEYQVNAVRDADPIAESVIEIAPDVEILDVRAGANHLDEVPGELAFREEQALVDISNNGTGPTEVQQLTIDGFVPNPTEDPPQGNTGIYSPDEHRNSPILVPEGHLVLVSDSMPFVFGSSGVACTDELQDGMIEVSVRLAGFGTVESEFDVQYAAKDDSGNCPIEIEKGD